MELRGGILEAEANSVDAQRVHAVAAAQSAADRNKVRGHVADRRQRCVAGGGTLLAPYGSETRRRRNILVAPLCGTFALVICVPAGELGSSSSITVGALLQLLANSSTCSIA